MVDRRFSCSKSKNLTDTPCHTFRTADTILHPNRKRSIFYLSNITKQDLRVEPLVLNLKVTIAENRASFADMGHGGRIWTTINIISTNDNVETGGSEFSTNR